MDSIRSFVNSREGDTSLVLSPFFDGTVTHDAQDEYTLPDYFPEIRRIVSVSARALPESKFMSDAKMEFGGTVTFTVMYVGDDGKLACVPYAFAYTGTTALPELAREGACITVDTRAESPTCRVLAPRRITLKARLRSRILADSPKRTDVAVTSSDGAKVTPADTIALEAKKERGITAVRCSGTMTASLSGTIRESERLKLISCDGGVTVTSAVAHDGAVKVTGEAEIIAISMTEDGRFVTSRAKTPFEESVPCDGAAEGAWARACGVSASSGVGVSEGDESTLTWDMEYDLSVEAVMRRDCEITTDMYSSACETVLSYTDIDSLAPFFLGNLPLSVDGSAPVDGDGYVISRTAEAAADKIDIVGDRAVVSGSCTVKVILGGDEIRSAEVVLPFRAEAHSSSGMTGEGCEAVARCDVMIGAVTAHLDGGKLSVTAELTVSLMVMAKKRLHTVSSAELVKSQPITRDDSVLRLYYPVAGDTMWGIAKLYHAPLAELERANGSEVGDAPIIV